MKRTTLFLAILTILIALVGGVLVGVYVARKKAAEKIVQLEPPALVKNEFIFSNPDIPEDTPYNVAGLTGLEVVDYIADAGDVGGSKKAELKVMSALPGKETLTIPLIGKVLYVDLHPFPGTPREKVSDVTQLSIQKGDYIGVNFYYIDEESAKKYKKEDRQSYCEMRNDEACLLSLNAGFGEIIINFNEYLNEVAGGKDNYSFDYTKVVAAQLIKVSQVE